MASASTARLDSAGPAKNVLPRGHGPPRQPPSARVSDRLRTPRLLVAFGGLSYILFPIPIITLFWKEQIGLTLTEIMLLQAIFGSASVLLEFPSGYLADRVGYRTALVAGVLLWTVGWVLYA